MADPNKNQEKSGVCGQLRTLRVELTETVGIHEVQLKCVLKPKESRDLPKVLEDVATIKVVPGMYGWISIISKQ